MTTMRLLLSKAALGLAVLLGCTQSVTAQTTLYDDPLNKWVTTFLPMRDNNGLVWAPDDALLYATAVDATVAAIDPDDGTIEWQFVPPGDGTVPFSCNGEVSFAADGTFLVYAVTEGDSCKVHALSHPEGELLWSSPPLEGMCEGTPFYTTFDNYVFVIHNSAGGTIGHFSVLDANTPSAISVTYNYTDPTNPFGPFGVYRQPSPGGNYPAGVGNTNDLAIWSHKPLPTATFGDPGSSFAFQMPPPLSLAPPTVTTLLQVTSWRSTAPPLLASNGQELYWLNSRSQVRGWRDVPFSVGPDAQANFDRGTPPFRAAPYTPVLDDILNPTVLCGGPADAEFACLSISGTTNGSMPILWTVEGGLVTGDPLMSTGGDRVYWVDTSGTVSAYDPLTGTPAWTAATGAFLEANPELSSDGASLFFADNGGNIVAWEVAESTLSSVPVPPTSQPAAGAAGESIVPTLVAADTSMPSLLDLDEPTAAPAPVLTASPVTTSPPTETSSASSLSSMVVFVSTMFVAVCVSVMHVCL